MTVFKGFVGTSYLLRNSRFDAQRCVNLHPSADETQLGKDGQATQLERTPGLTLLAVPTSGSTPPIPTPPFGIVEVHFTTPTDLTGWRTAVGPGFASGNVLIADGMLRLTLSTDDAGVVTGAEIISKDRYGYGAYEFMVRASSVAVHPDVPGASQSGSLTTLQSAYDAGGAGAVNITNQAEGVRSRSKYWQLANGDDAAWSPEITPDEIFYRLTYLWAPDKVEFYIDGELTYTSTDNVPTIAGNVIIGHLGTNSDALGGFHSDAPRQMYVSLFRYTPTNLNLARNSSFELQAANRPTYYASYSITDPETTVTWTAPAGRTAGLAFGLQSNQVVTSPTPYGLRTAPWEDPDHSTVDTRIGLEIPWQSNIDYVVSLYAKKVAGAGWTTLRLGWNNNPDVSVDLLNPSLSTSWQRYGWHIKWTTTPVETLGNLFVSVTGSTAIGDELQLDDLSVLYGSALVPYVREATSPVLITGPTPMPSRVLATYFKCYDPTLALADVSLAYNTIYLFNAEPLRDAPYPGTFFFPYLNTITAGDVAVCRNRGQRVLLSVGGYNAGFNFTTRAESSAFVRSFQTIYQALGGLDGCDFDNFEEYTVSPDPPFVPASDPVEMIWIATQLRTLYGSNFSITMPPAPSHVYDQTLALAMVTAGVLNYAAPQFYDWSGFDVPTDEGFIDAWVTLLGASHVAVGLGANYPYMGSLTVPQNVDVWMYAKSTYPTIKGLFGWSAQDDAEHGWTFGTAMAALL